MKNLISNVNRKLGRKSRKGFSLVELLVVIAVIGVIAAIAIPAMSNVFENSRSAKAKRNAQNIASTYAAARAAGATFTEAQLASAGTVGTALSAGVNGSGQFRTTKFQVALDPAEITAATGLDLLALEDGGAGTKILTYKGTNSDLAPTPTTP